MSLIIKRTEQSKVSMQIASSKLNFNDLPAKSVCLMLLSSKNDKSDGIKTFVVYSSYIKLAINIFKQTKTLIYVMVYIVEKV